MDSSSQDGVDYQTMREETVLLITMQPICAGRVCRIFSRNLVLSLAVSVLLLACGEKPQARPPAPPEVTVLKVEPKDTPVIFEFVGITESSQQVEVHSRVNAFLDDRLYTEGGIVKKGDVMFQMDPKPFQVQLDAANAALAEQKARLWTASADLKRVKPLAKAKAVSMKELDDSQGRVNAAAAAVEMAKAEVETAKLNLGYTTIYAPVTGASSFARVQNGAYVDQQDSLLTYVAQLDPIWIDFSVSEDKMLSVREQLKDGTLLHLEGVEGLNIKLVMADGSIYPETGQLFFQDANYSTDTGTFLVRATIGNPDEILRPGQFVQVQVVGYIRPKAIMVPQQSVLQGAKGFFVWVVDSGGKAQVRAVTVGDWHGDEWFISKGLKSGDQVVTDGLVRLAKETPVKIVAARPKAAGN